MGQLELFAQRTFAEETERITEGAARWQDPPEIRLEKVTGDGYLVIRRSRLLEHLAPPWPEALAHGEVMIELKLARNHLDRKAVARALLRRQAREVQRLEEEDAWQDEEPLWLVAPHVPRWLQELRRAVRFAPGCYRIDPYGPNFLWIAANELPLVDELIPFLLARSGQALDDFGQWVALRRRPEWMLTMLKYFPMSIPTREELLRRFGPVDDDPEIEARRQHILQFLLEQDPKMKQRLQQEGQQEGRQEGRLTGTRTSLRRVLAGRQLTPSMDDDARIEACTDLATLERWLDRAITAASVSDVLG